MDFVFAGVVSIGVAALMRYLGSSSLRCSPFVSGMRLLASLLEPRAQALNAQVQLYGLHPVRPATALSSRLKHEPPRRGRLHILHSPRSQVSATLLAVHAACKKRRS